MKLILEVTPRQLAERAMYLAKNNDNHIDMEYRIELIEVIYRGRWKVYKLKPIYDKNAARKKLEVMK